jgi:anthranilate synthase component II
MKIRVLVVDNFDSFTFNLIEILSYNADCEFSIVQNDMNVLEEAANNDKILLAPGAGVPLDAPILKEVIAEYQSSKSILGVCLGHQAIAEFYGGKLFNLERANHGIKTTLSIIDNNNYLFYDIPDGISVGLYHSWAVDKNNIPDELKISAIDENNIIMAIEHNKYDVKGIQFHPESYMTQEGSQILNNWLNH